MHDTLPDDGAAFEHDAPAIPRKVRTLAEAAERCSAERRLTDAPGNGGALGLALILTAASVMGWMTGASNEAAAMFWGRALASGVIGHCYARYRHAFEEDVVIEDELRAMG